MKISKQDLTKKWDDYELERKDKIAKILEVIGYVTFVGEEEDSVGAGEPGRSGHQPRQFLQQKLQELEEHGHAGLRQSQSQ